MKYLFVFCLFVAGVLAKHEIYDGHAVYQVDVTSMDQVKLVHDFENDLMLDVWSDAVPGRPGKVLVPKFKREIFENFLKQSGVQYKLEVENVKEQLELEDQLLAAAAAKSNSTRSRLSFEKIHSYEEVDAYLQELAKEFPNVVTVVEGGKSFEGRSIKYLRISTTNFQDASKPVVMMQSLLHCREWVTLPATLYAIHKLVIDVTESDLINNIDWIILPVANPDGYVHTFGGDRYWRKNRATGYMAGNLCMGVDLNRNFGMNWGTASSSSVCSDTFHGRSAFSEPETSVIRDIIAEHRNRMALYLDIHSFGSMILYGYGNGVLPSNALQLHLIGVQMAQAIDRVKWSSNKDYIVGNIFHVLYAASGGASDYAMQAAAPFSYTYELPAYRNSVWFDGFLVDPDFIEQAGFETWEGIKVGARAAAAAAKELKNLNTA
ncbi:carboxypeptidase B-like [Helicoverpa zea]|uniref:carboxypeptidase B-like n=1 Tax=Helicoverpa zea TaxID=7113 RepID=UPI001F57A545|nr:carboxypeptidase B-like [Helicoverpa zea]